MLRKKEVKKKDFTSLMLTSFLAAIIFFFHTWRNTPFELAEGVGYFFFIFIFSLVLMKICFELQKWYAKKWGYGLIYVPNPNMMLLAILIGFISRGFLFLFFLGDVHLIFDWKKRIGQHQSHLNVRDLAGASIPGPALLLVLSWIFAGIHQATQNPLVYDMLKISMIFAIFFWIPTANSLGLNVYQWNRKFFIIGFFVLLVFSALLLTDFTFFIALLISLFLAFLIGFLEYIPKVVYA